MRKAETGFTLLEVLAAVAILAILYTVLAGSAMDGLLAEGLSKRRLEASLLADHWLADLELQLNAGGSPALGELEEEDGDFRVRVTVEPFDLILPELETGNTAPKPVLSDLSLDRTSPLRLIQIRVSWLEAETEYQVTRTTFGFDANALDPSKLPQPEATAQPGAQDDGTGAGTAPEPEPAQ
jgi:prepilin-type N-terminal cleavage/methylation domain-containing protein